jgi:SAM-dependent methyltransferase
MVNFFRKFINHYKKRSIVVLKGDLLLNRETISNFYIKGDGIEIGALNGALPVNEAARVKYVDRMPVEELKKQYQGLELVNVDIVDDGERLDKIPDSSLDFVIANHFLEHCPNPILAIMNMLRVLKEGGILYLSIPDKRYTFDSERPVTGLEHLIKDYNLSPGWSREQHFEEWVKYITKKDGFDAEQHKKWMMEIDYSIHYHVWTQREMFDLLSVLKEKFNQTFEFELFFKSGLECIFILKK